MAKFEIKQLDVNVSHADQLADESEGPVTLINIFQVDADKDDAFVEMWGGIIREFKFAPGFISAQFYRGTAGSTTFMNQAVWETPLTARPSTTRSSWASHRDYPEGTVATPHLFRKAAIANVCVA